MYCTRGMTRPSIKPFVPKPVDDLAILKKENAILRKKLEEMSKSKLSAADRNRLLEILPNIEELTKVQITEARLKDALDKNRHWLEYDQEREHYVSGIMFRLLTLEHQMAKAKRTQQAPKKESVSDTSEAKDDNQKCHEQLLAAERDLEAERQLTSQLKTDLFSARLLLEQKSKDLAKASAGLQSMRDTEQEHWEKTHKWYKENGLKIRDNRDMYRKMYEEEKKKNQNLSYQVQQCTNDLKNGKIDQQHVQEQLNEVLEELKKTREQISKLEPAKRDIYFVDSSCNFPSDGNEKLDLQEDPAPKNKNLLDESFLECPTCRAVYPTSQHRELLAHIDFCSI
ncbi:centrosomal protein of 55 kDa isoform 2-T3 [Anomaloglossus baeobatrachus]|uniref:centrosomal protein of 55 kDa isoform X2 n=1 Tax=Anomaloglossus baeobatrachus TaxID=238106 RepID=UPI003F503B6C